VAAGGRRRSRSGADTWLRQRGGTFLREVLGAAWTARADRLGVEGRCACGGAQQFRQRRPMRLQTVLPGRDVSVRLPYGQCEACHTGVRPLLSDLGVDAEGFTPGLRELAVLASVVEPYEAASRELLGRFAGVTVSTEKLQALVQAVAPVAGAMERPDPPVARHGGAPCVAIDGGMIFVEGRWQEVNLACVFEPESRATPDTRPTLTARQVVAVRGTPEALAAQLSLIRQNAASSWCLVLRAWSVPGAESRRPRPHVTPPAVTRPCAPAA